MSTQSLPQWLRVVIFSADFNLSLKIISLPLCRICFIT
ncbi:hypothetical protein BRV41_000359 [Escherichia coli]|uniref:Uncharacterized protein n=1 Tax=Escherichia marmotae TaxID=1499973 RepID=A0A7L5X3J0_9ESCH|nr:hypothetical protein [Escherichia coli]EFG2026667.1 hypothetical protein [Escherichia coli]QLP26508.1 hypothetical protein HV018_07380 [Escherichia marmotae]